MQKSCEEISKMLVDYADGQLSSSETNEVAGHIERCESCQRTLKALQSSLDLAGIIWQDNLTDVESIHIKVPRKTVKFSWARYTAIAASILLVLSGSILWRLLSKPTKPELTFAKIERKITEAGNAARLLAATELLAKYPDVEDIVKQQYRYIVETYPETPAAAEAKLQINEFK